MNLTTGNPTVIVCTLDSRLCVLAFQQVCFLHVGVCFLFRYQITTRDKFCKGAFVRIYNLFRIGVIVHSLVIVLSR